MDKLIKKVGRTFGKAGRESERVRTDPEYLKADACPVGGEEENPGTITENENPIRPRDEFSGGFPPSQNQANQFNSPSQTIYQFNQANGIHIGNVYTITQNLNQQDEDEVDRKISSGPNPADEDSTKGAPTTDTNSSSSSLRKKFPKTRTIDLLLKSDTEIEHSEIDVIATHLGEDWRSVGRDLGFSNGEIQQFHEDHFVAGIKEVIYQMLTNWKQREEDPTVGQICQVLWKRDIHREVVCKLKMDYKRRNKHLMGSLLSIFRRTPSSEEKLTKLEEKIKYLENYSLETRERQRLFAGRFLVASIGTYVIAFIIFYFYFFPPTWKDRLLYSTPLLLFPVIIILIKACVSWYFDSKVDRNNRQLIKLRHEKKQILQNVMDKETYKVALEILNTFGDRSMKLKSAHELDSSTALLNSSLNTSAQLRTPVRNTQGNRLLVGGATPSAPANIGNTPAIGFRSSFQPTPSTNVAIRRVEGALAGASNAMAKQTPFPIIDARKQNIVEKMMDFIISDGPSSRLAMICNSCCGHNGMALQEEFEYVAFKCAFCAAFNPARKIRPKARGLTPERKAIVAPMNDLDSSSDEDEVDLKKDRQPIPAQAMDISANGDEPDENDNGTEKGEDVAAEPKDLAEKKDD